MCNADFMWELERDGNNKPYEQLCIVHELIKLDRLCLNREK